MHGLFFFFIRKFADTCAANVSETASADLRSRIERTATYLPDGSCPDSEATELLEAVGVALDEPLELTQAKFGEYVARHLIRVAGARIDRSWRTLEVVEHADDLIRSLVHEQQDFSAPPVHEALRISPTELHLVYYSQRKMCAVASGIIRGVASHFGETVQIDESACMRRGAPYCSFVVRHLGNGSPSWIALSNETISVPSATVDRKGDPGLVDDPSSDDSIPATIGPYFVLCSIAHGSMGRVFLARDEQLGRAVAIKVLLASQARDTRARQRFLREGRTAAAISHPHVLTVYGVGEQEGQPYIVMQHLEGRPLSACARPLPLPVALRIGREIASGLAAAHAKGLIHRDIKPHNIILEEPHQSVRIIDFGLARETQEQSPSLTADGIIVGTPAYLSPERLGDDAIDPRTDLFGLGVVLYELISGRLPYEGDSTLTMLASIARGDPLPLARAAPSAPREVCDFVMRLMAHRREDRPRDAETVEAELAALEHQFAAT